MNTRARIATVCQANCRLPSVEQNRSHVLKTLQQALAVKPDLVCLPENFATVGLPGDAAALAEPVPGPTTELFAAEARRAGCYIICPLLMRERDQVRNAAVVLDRRGEVAGIYHKRRPVTTSPDYTEMERGVAPGAEDGIFDLDFGRIGIRICFDAGFPEDWELLARQDVRLVFWPSAYDGGNSLAVYALLHRYYVVTSVRTERSRIIDPCGEMLAHTDRLCNVTWRDINLDYAVCHYDFNFSIPDRIVADYGDRVEVRSQVDGACFLVSPNDPSVTVQALQARYGFETALQYFNRHRCAYSALASGRPEPQQAAHGDRAMYAKS